MQFWRWEFFIFHPIKFGFLLNSSQSEHSMVWLQIFSISYHFLDELYQNGWKIQFCIIFIFHLVCMFFPIDYLWKIQQKLTPSIFKHFYIQWVKGFKKGNFAGDKFYFLSDFHWENLGYSHWEISGVCQLIFLCLSIFMINGGRIVDLNDVKKFIFHPIDVFSVRAFTNHD